EAALTVLTLEPGAEVPPHVHEKSVELLYVLEGEARMTLEGETLVLRAGAAVRIPMNARHSAQVTSKGPLKAVQVYSPSGPEQRFRAPAK
ncbi:MAG: cupin domain-containing protein, partial [Myxococcales bacterium]